MKMRSKKGFTIVELVIVIAVIAILAAVMIPTFSGIVGKAKESVALQEARNEYTAYTGTLTDMENIGDLLIVVDDEYAIKVVDGQIDADVFKYADVAEGYETEDLTKYDVPVDVYALTEDEAVNGNKTYYTVADGVYTAVAEPVDESIGNYYEKSVGTESADHGKDEVAIYAAK